MQGTGEIGSLYRGLIRHIENLEITNLRKNNQNRRYIDHIEVKLIIVFLELGCATQHFRI